MDKRTRYSKEVKERSVRLVFETTEEHGSQWGAIESIAMKIGCTVNTVQKLQVFTGAKLQVSGKNILEVNDSYFQPVFHPV